MTKLTLNREVILPELLIALFHLVLDLEHLLLLRREVVDLVIKICP